MWERNHPPVKKFAIWLFAGKPKVLARYHASSKEASFSKSGHGCCYEHMETSLIKTQRFQGGLAPSVGAEMIDPVSRGSCSQGPGPSSTYR